MKPSDLRGKSRAEQLAIAAQYAGLDASVFEGMWGVESSNGKNMRSPKGAEGHFGLMPATRATWEAKAGQALDPNDFADGLYMAAETMKENLGKFKNVPDALRAYNGGWSPRNWLNEETAAYAEKVLGTTYTSPALPANNVLTLEQLQQIDPHEAIKISPGVLQKPERPDTVKVDDMVAQAFNNPYVQAPAGELKDTLAEARGQERYAAAVYNEAHKPQHSFGDKFVAAIGDTLTAAALRAIEREGEDYDPEWIKNYSRDFAELEKPAQTEQDVRWLRDSGSKAEYDRTVGEIAERNQRRAVYGSDGTLETMAWSLGTGVIDPAGWAAGAGIGKGLQMAGLGARALMAAGRPIMAAGSLIAEGSIGNVVTTGMLEAGEGRATWEDLAVAGAAGGIIGAIQAPFFIKGAQDHSVAEAFKERHAAASEAMADRYFRAGEKLGPNATREAIDLEVDSTLRDEALAKVRMSLAPKGDEQRFLPKNQEAFLSADPDVKAKVESQFDLAAISDMDERAAVIEKIAQAQRMVAELGDAKAHKTILSKMSFGGNRGLESTSNTLHNSESVVARAVAMQLLEDPTGTGGRRMTGAMSLAVNQRLYNANFLPDYGSHYNAWRKANGHSLVSEFLNDAPRKAFDRALALEIHARSAPRLGGLEPDVHVKAAADKWEAAMDYMRIAQQETDVVGSARFGDNSKGYMPHHMSAEEMSKLTNDELKAVRQVYEDQFVSLNEFDRKFSRKLAASYIEVATNKRYGMHPVPVNLHSAAAGDLVRLAMERVGLKGDDLEKAMTKFNNGGAGHTKTRLRIDMFQDIGNGKKLIDLYDTDMEALYRSYSRRVAGDVALAQHGVMGKKGLDILKQGMIRTGATPGEMEAFDQIAAEFLNMPYGNHQHKWMDNLRTGTSAARLGGVVFTQLGESGNGIAALGVHAVFKSIGALPKIAKQIGQLKRGEHFEDSLLGSLDLMGGHIGYDDYLNSNLVTIRDNDIQMYGRERIGVISKAIRAGANAQYIATGHRMVTAGQTRGMAEQIVMKTFRYLREGKENDVHLRQMGIDDTLMGELRDNMDKMATFDSQGRLTKLDLFKGEMSAHSMHRFRNAVEVGASQIIQRTYVGETGKWAHDGMLKLLLQFRTFGVVSAEKQWGRNVQNMGALGAGMALIAAMSWSLPIHMARVHAKTVGMSREKREEYIKANMTPGMLARSTMGYASSSGFATDIWDVAGGMYSGWGGTSGSSAAEAFGVRGSDRRALTGGVVAPAAGLANDVWAGVNGDPMKIVKAIPGSNTIYAQPFVNMLNND